MCSDYNVSSKTVLWIHSPVIRNLLIMTDDNTDPVTNQAISIGNDFGFTNTITTSRAFPKWFLPCAGDFKPNEPAWHIARHTQPTTKDLAEAGMSLQDALYLFQGFDVKCVSSGSVLASNDLLICASVSCTRGSSGGPLLVGELSLNHLAGICIGAPSSVGDISYNRFLSVHHPMFVVNYAQFIVPDLPIDSQTLIRPYLERHRSTMLKYPSN